MFPLLRCQEINLATTGRKRARVGSTNAKENEFGHIPKVEPHSSPIGPPVLSDLVPYNIAFVVEAPRLQYANSIRQQRVGYPQVQVRGIRRHVVDGQCGDFVKLHCAIASQALMFRRHLSGAVLKLPRRIRKNRVEFLLRTRIKQIVGCCFQAINPQYKAI
jgi:hypothetical protein